MKTIEAGPFYFRERKMTKLVFGYDKNLIERVKKIPGRIWSADDKCWFVPHHENPHSYLRKYFDEETEIISNVSTDSIIPANKRVKEDSVGQVEEATGKISKVEINVLFNKAEGLLYMKVPYSKKDEIKKLDGAQWHSRSKFWIAYANDENLQQIKENFSDTEIAVNITESSFTLRKVKRDVYKDMDQLTELHKKEIEEFKRWMIQKRYSDNTVKIYTSCLTVFYRYYSKKSIQEIDIKDIENFNHEFILKHNYSPKTQNQYISAIKTFYILNNS